MKWSATRRARTEAGADTKYPKKKMQALPIVYTLEWCLNPETNQRNQYFRKHNKRRHAAYKRKKLNWASKELTTTILERASR